MTRYATFAGVGSYLPERLVPNDWFESRVDTSDAWIRDRTGIEARHFVAEGETTSDLATEAARRALASAAIPAEQLDLIVCATVTGDTNFPSTAIWIQRKLGVSCPAYDVNAACSGYSYAASTGTAFVTSGMADTVLVIGAESFSRIIDFTDRGTCILFGDGAGATVLTAADAPGVEGSILGADASAAEILWMPVGGTREPTTHESLDAGAQYVRMPNGREVFKRAVTEMSAACRELLDKSGYAVDEVDVLIPHQANARIMSAVVDRLKIDPAKAIVDVAEVGNTSAASIPIALDRAWRRGAIHTGDLVLLTSFGAGLTWGATLVRWTMPEAS